MKKIKPQLRNVILFCVQDYFDEEENLKYYENLLKDFTKKKLVCTNPDLTVHRGGEEEYCAGKIAEIFEGLRWRSNIFWKTLHKKFIFHV